MATKTLARWPRVGEVPYQALPLLRFFAYKIRTREKVRKREGEPGDEAKSIVPCVEAGHQNGNPITRSIITWCVM